MANKKSFAEDNPAYDFLLSHDKPEQEQKNKPKQHDQVAEPIEPTPAKAEEQAPVLEPLKAETTKKTVDYIETREPKSKRLQLLIRPTTLAKIKKQAKRERKSVNELVNELMEDYLERNF